jgi:acetolactate synthase-1/2/3 large subunit
LLKLEIPAEWFIHSERITMNGAKILVKTAIQAGIKVCFTNPGTTEIPLVLALNSEPGLKAVLGLFEGVCTGAADGYGRMLDEPALTLLHLGPGLANGIANLHNARRANVPLVNLIGEHATWHRAADSPLTMDIETLSSTVSGWYKTNQSPETLSRDLADAMAASACGQISTLIIPNDNQLAECCNDKIVRPVFSFDPVDSDAIDTAAQVLRTYQRTALVLGGRSLRRRGLRAAARIKAATGCDLITEHLPAYIERGAGLPDVTRIPYYPGAAIKLLSQYEAVVLVQTREPVSFFGYEGFSSYLLGTDQKKIKIAGLGQDDAEVLERLGEALGAGMSQTIPGTILSMQDRPGIPIGQLTPENVCLTVAALQPENAIIVDEGITTSGAYFPLSAGLPWHSFLTTAGGSIGWGMPCALGASIACPERPVINLQADGSAMYTVQALWTEAREALNVTTLICANKSYNILKSELSRIGGAAIPPHVFSLIDLQRPDINWTDLAEGMGVPGVKVDTTEGLARELGRSLSEPGPHLIEMLIC